MGKGKPSTVPVCILVLAALLSGASARAQYFGKSVPAVMIDTPPVIDGKLDDEAWKLAPLITDFHQVHPDEYQAPSEVTEVRILLDSEYLYVGARLHYSDMEMLTANVMTPQSRIWNEDRIYVVIDPFLDRRNGYHFESNVFGIQGDALIENNRQRINEWSGVWQVRTSRDERGWNAEFRIPFATMSFNPGITDWGINFFRDIKYTQERLAWSSQGRQDLLEAPSAAGTLTGIGGIEKGLGLDVIPSVSLSTNRDFTNDSDDSRFEPSLDLTYRITPSLTGKLTLNTDFSATEVDDRQVNLTRFSLFFPEKRNFFLQDAGIFEFGRLSGNGRPFFSRTIGLVDGQPLNLNAGLKLTGRVGGWNVGFLGVQQESYGTLDEQNLFVGRAVANVFEESSVGIIMTDGDPSQDRSARTLGADFRYRDSDIFSGNLLTGEVWYQRSDNEDGGTDDSAWGVGLGFPNDRHSASLTMTEIGNDFDPAMGFVNRNGIRQSFAQYQFRQRPETGAWRWRSAQLAAQNIESIVNSELTRVLEFIPWHAETTSGDRFAVSFKRHREVLESGFDLFGKIAVPAGDFEYSTLTLIAETAPFRKFRVEARLETGDFLNGKQDSLNAKLEWSPAARFRFEFEYGVNKVNLPTGDFTARVFSLESRIAFNERWSFVPLLQFDNISEELGINLRLRLHPSRGSDFFFVWSRNMLRDIDNRFHSTHQKTVLKGTYTFRF